MKAMLRNEVQASMAMISDEERTKCELHMEQYLARNPSITNRELRALTGISYDQAITFFNAMIANGRLVRIGKSSGTKYRLSSMPPKDS